MYLELYNEYKYRGMVFKIIHCDDAGKYKDTKQICIKLKKIIGTRGNIFDLKNRFYTYQNNGEGSNNEQFLSTYKLLEKSEYGSLIKESNEFIEKLCESILEELFDENNEFYQNIVTIYNFLQGNKNATTEEIW